MRKLTSALVLILWLAAVPDARANFIVNIGATQSGFTPGTPTGTRMPGDPAVPVGIVNQMTLAAGDYLITNAAGLPGADPNDIGWRYDGGNDWVWNFVIADASTNKVLILGFAGTENGIGVWSSQAELASQPSVQNFSTILSLSATTTINFGVRDYYLPDNAGGVSLLIHTSAVPEPGSLTLVGIGATGLFLGWRVRRR